MPNSRPPLSVKSRQLGSYGMHSVVNADTTEDVAMSPESEQGSGTPSEDSPKSHHSWGLTTSPLPEDGDDPVMDVPTSPEDRDDLGSNDDNSSEDGSMSSRSRGSYGIYSMPLPESQDHVLPAGYILRVQDEETELPPVPAADERRVSAPPAPM